MGALEIWSQPTSAGVGRDWPSISVFTCGKEPCAAA